MEKTITLSFLRSMRGRLEKSRQNISDRLRYHKEEYSPKEIAMFREDERKKALMIKRLDRVIEYIELNID